MDVEKLRPQVKALAIMYRLMIEALDKMDRDTGQAAIYPYKYWGLAVGELHKMRKNTPKLDKQICELCTALDLETWSEFYHKPMPLDLQGTWQMYFVIGLANSGLEGKRREKRLTQTQLGDMIGADQQCISRWENGKVKPNMDNIKKLANALDCTVDDLIGEIDKWD